MKVVADSTPLIELSKIRQLELLRDVYGSIIIPDVKPILDNLRDHGTRISQRLYHQTLTTAGE